MSTTQNPSNHTAIPATAPDKTQHQGPPDRAPRLRVPLRQGRPRPRHARRRADHPHPPPRTLTKPKRFSNPQERQDRSTITINVRPDDRVLEIGCEWGTTSAYLAKAAARLVATDVSAECIERARAKHSDIRFETLDAFDLLAVQAHAPVDVVYVDVSGLSGFRSLLDVLAVLNAYSNLLAPRVIVIKSGALVSLARRLSVATDPRALP